MPDRHGPLDNAKSLAASQWAKTHRANGAAITVQGSNGAYYHADDSFWDMIERSSPAANGFDLIPPELSGRGAEMVAEHYGKPARVWFPFKSDRGRQIWCRFESKWVDGLMACAIWPETDENHWHLHAEAI